ncbi:hypothetical protein DBR22_20950 [Arthrobacter sp. HMWF013]|nr:hypothetical protein DBR22_20950 [Arthrobacter sp. HMWF013]
MGYLVSQENGRQGFLKVLDLASVVSHGVDAMLEATSAYVAERDLLVMCGTRKLSRVVTAISYGQFKLSNFMLSDINYIIFELASHDVRVALSQAGTITNALKLEYLRNLAVGLRQLHSNEVAHQDLKPSNFLLFPDDVNGGRVGKVADLGRAYRKGAPASHDQLVTPGDRTYAPPEQLYRYIFPEESVRRFAADLYQLGSMATFMFTGTTMNSLLADELSEHHHWDAFGDSFLEVLPYLEDAYSRIITTLQSDLATDTDPRLGAVVEFLCQPDPRRRGHPAAVKGRGSRFSLERVVSEIDLMAHKAYVRARAAA